MLHKIYHKYFYRRDILILFFTALIFATVFWFLVSPFVYIIRYGWVAKSAIYTSLTTDLAIFITFYFYTYLTKWEKKFNKYIRVILLLFFPFFPAMIAIFMEMNNIDGEFLAFLIFSFFQYIIIVFNAWLLSSFTVKSRFEKYLEKKQLSFLSTFLIISISLSIIYLGILVVIVDIPVPEKLFDYPLTYNIFHAMKIVIIFTIIMFFILLVFSKSRVEKFLSLKIDESKENHKRNRFIFYGIFLLIIFCMGYITYKFYNLPKDVRTYEKVYS